MQERGVGRGGKDALWGLRSRKRGRDVLDMREEGYLRKQGEGTEGAGGRKGEETRRTCSRGWREAQRNGMQECQEDLLSFSSGKHNLDKNM